MKQKIEEWLNSESKDYKEGIMLLDSIHRNKVLIRFIGQKETKANMDRINYHLSNYVGKPYIPMVEVETKPLRNEVQKMQPRVSFSVNIEPIKQAPEELLDKKRNLFNHRNKLSQAIQDQTKGKTDLNDEDKELVKELLAIDESIKAIDSQIEYWNKYGKLYSQEKEELPENKELTVANADEQKNKIFQLKKLIKNQLTYITKAKAKFDKNPENLRLAEDLEKKRQELKRLHLVKEEIQSFSF
jgi:chromosome segregation ATPase